MVKLGSIFKKAPSWLWECPQDSDVLKTHFKLGSDFEKPFAVDAFSYFPDKSKADKAAAKISTSGTWQVDVHQIDAQDVDDNISDDVVRMEGDWTVEAHADEYMLNLAGVKAMRNLFESVATEFGGEYDGWGAPINR